MMYMIMMKAIMLMFENADICHLNIWMFENAVLNV